VLNQAYHRTEVHYSAQGKLEIFRLLRAFLQDPNAAPYADAARELAKSEAAVKTEVYRLRRVFADAFRSIVAQTVVSHADVEEEVRYLVRLLTR
jgi:hypothetical protein